VTSATRLERDVFIGGIIYAPPPCVQIE